MAQLGTNDGQECPSPSPRPCDMRVVLYMCVPRQQESVKLVKEVLTEGKNGKRGKEGKIGGRPIHQLHQFDQIHQLDQMLAPT